MPATLTLDLGEFAPYLLRLGPRFFVAARRGAIRTGMRAVSTLQRATSAAKPANPQRLGVGGAVNTGAYKRAWKTHPTSTGADVFNSAMYAAVVEEGRVPGVGVPLKPLENWAQRRLGVSRDQARNVAYAISRRIAARGLVGRKVLEGSLHKIEHDFMHEVEVELEKEASLP